MIIGQILDVSTSSGIPGSQYSNGVTMMHFYTWSDAITWAVLASETAFYNTQSLTAACMIINTDTGERRWWYNGIEYTG